jgi:uncharacterized protein YceK
MHMRKNSYPDLSKLILMPLVTLVMMSGCGMLIKDDKNKPAAGAPAPITLTPFEQMTGEWVGIYHTIDEGKPLGEAQSLTASFRENGQFTLAMDSDASARVEGYWNEFQGKSLILRISGSSISRVGSAGKVAEPTYELSGSSLRIASEAYELKLSKKPGPTSPESPGGWHSVFMGTWVCLAASHRKTTIVISEPGDFKLSSVLGNERTFIALGKVNPKDSNSVQLTATSSSDPVEEGASFDLQQSSKSTELFFTRKNLTQSLLGSCHR